MKKTAAALVFIAASALNAQEFRYGAQGTVALPLGDAGQKEFLNLRPAAGVGIHGIWSIHPRHALVPRADFVFYRRNYDGNNLNVFKSSATLIDMKVGLDYNLITKFGGLYGIGGLGLSSFDWAGDDFERQKKSTVYFSLGAGYPLTNHFVAEMRYTHASYSDVGFKGMSRTAPALGLSLMWRY